jgi:hypothetical protein
VEILDDDDERRVRGKVSEQRRQSTDDLRSNHRT